MTRATSVPELDVALEPARPLPVGKRGSRAPWYLWLAAFVALVPVGVPFVNLVGRVLTGGGQSLDTVLSVRTLQLLWNTSLLTVAVTAASTAIGVAAAWAVVRGNVRMPRLWSVFLTLPLVIPSYVIALTLRSSFGPSGLISDALGAPMPIVSGFAGAWLALTLSTYPFVFLVANGLLRRLDPSLEEAARGLGASPARVFRTVVVPQLRPAIGSGALLVALYTLSDFGAVSLMRFDVFTRVVYAQYAGRIDRTPAATFAVVLVALALAVLVAEQWSRGRAAYYTSRPPRRPAQQSGRPRRLVGLYLAMLVTTALLAPLAVLAAWVGRGLGQGQSLDFAWSAAAGSLVAALLSAGLAVVLALPIGVLVTRFGSRATGWLERAVYAAYALPHIAVALAVVFFASNYLGGLYQSLTLLVLVYGALFLAQALGTTRAGLLRVSPHLEDASRSLGRGPLRTMRSVTVPLVWRSMVAGGILVFLTAMKELPAMLLLRPTGFDALSVEIWFAADDLLYARAAIPALLLVAVSAIPMYLIATSTDDT